MREKNKERFSATTLASADGANTIIRNAEKPKTREGRAGDSKSGGREQGMNTKHC
jgi:hypothetical protein